MSTVIKGSASGQINLNDTTGSIQLNGSDVLTIDSSGNLTAPNNLTVTGTVTQTGGATFNGGISGNVAFDTNTLYVDATNNRVGIGTSSPVTSFQVAGATSTILGGTGVNGDSVFSGSFASITKPKIAVQYDNNNWGVTQKDQSGIGMDFTNGVLQICSNYQYTGGGKIAFYTGNLNSSSGALSERMRIASSGNVLIGKTSAYGASLESTAPLEVAVFQNTGGTGNVRFQNSGGSTVGYIQWTTTTQYNTSSDYRLKENITPMTGALEKIALLNPVNWTWKIDGSNGQGFIAHELQTIVPDCVSGEKDAVDENGNPEYQGVDTSFLVATLVKAIQEQQAMITALETRIQALESA